MEAVFALLPAILLLAICIISIVITRRLGLSPIVGYLLGGLLIGEHAFGLFHESETVHLLAELGVVFLLFDIGLHFSIRHIWEARRDIFGLGPIQITLCTAAFAALGRTLRGGIAVGTVIADRPPHRSVREVLPHTAPPLGRTITAP